GLPCLFALLLDDGLTLHGQPAEYWAGDYAQTTEGAPFYRKLYAWHPAAAVCGHLVWAGLLGGLLVLVQYFVIIPPFALMAKRSARREPKGFVPHEDRPLRSQY
ncbi:MAG TPA: hypothetical protein VKE22_03535, partial [Haliangiales bacterium]|nr:hypothetical protein [Haliangiales bacterium]